MQALRPEDLRLLLCELGGAIRAQVLAARTSQTSQELSGIAHVAKADTIYSIDKVSELAIRHWFEHHWPTAQPVQIVMEGIEDDQPLCYPFDLSPAQTVWKCIIDPIDGTRCIMHDKRSAWALAGIAPQFGHDTALSDIVAASMTELPTTKQWRSDQLSATKGGGMTGTSLNVLDGTSRPYAPQPSQAENFQHGFSWLTKYFPEGRTLTAQIEELLWEELNEERGPAAIFDDQYLSTGGAFYELIAGRDRMIGDLRPLIFATLGLDEPIVCHPYDVSAALVLTEAGVIYEDPFGGYPDAPMDTTSPVTWIAYANPVLAAKARPVLRKILNQILTR